MSKITNKDLIISRILTGSRYEYSIYEKRIFYRIVEVNEHLLKGLKLNERYSVDADIFGNRKYTMPISAFLKNEEDNNYARVKKAFLALATKGIEIEDENTWQATTLVVRPKIEKNEGIVTFELDLPIYQALLNFSKGFGKVELATIMGFESVYAMRFYEIIAQNKNNQNTILQYSFERLKEMFCLKDKYKQVNDFVRKVIEPAKRELDAKSPWSFTYKPYKHGRSVAGWYFCPVYQPAKRDPDLERKDLLQQVNLSWSLPRDVRLFLTGDIGFTKEEIKNNLADFEAAYRIKGSGFLKWLTNIDLSDKKNPKGYIIGAMRTIAAKGNK